MTPTPSRTDLNLLIASHGKTIHLVKVGSSNSLEDRPVQQAEAKDGLTATVTASLELPNQPSFAIEHPTIPGLIYVTSWIENKLFKIRVDQGGESGKENQNTFKVEAEANTGGGGPTFVLMKPGDDGLLIAHYRSGELSYLPLDPKTGDFLAQEPSPNHVLLLPFDESSTAPSTNLPPRSARLIERQSSSHPHQIVLLPTGEYLVPDLGSDTLYVMSFDPDARHDSQIPGWKIVSQTRLPTGWGPRHAVLATPKGSTEPLVYLVSELTSHLTIHRILHSHTSPSAATTTISQPIDGKTYSTWPKALRNGAYTPVGAFEGIACAIIYHNDHIYVSNRDIRPDLAPEGDSIAVFAIHGPDGRLVEKTAIVGPGTHLRGLEIKGDYMVVLSRDGGGLSIYQQNKKMGEEQHRWEPKLMNVLASQLDKPVGVTFL